MYQQIFDSHAAVLKAMSHPKRLEIIHLLRNQELSVSEIQRMLGLPQANLSQHLQVLRENGIVKTRHDGKQVFYSLSHKNFTESSDLVREVLIERTGSTQLGQAYRLNMTDLVPLVHDPVCGMRLSPKTASHAHEHAGLTHYFCAEGCLKDFLANPRKYMENE